VKKNSGKDEGVQYAMKMVCYKDVTKLEAGIKQSAIERYVHERGCESPFLVGLNYALTTPTHMFLVVGEYINNCS
jgi:hypothetical protein